MHFNDIEIGMKFTSKKGSGEVTWIDDATQTIYLANITDNNSLEVSFTELMEDPQAHNKKDTFY